MLAHILASLITAAPQSTESFARSVLEDVCLPYVAGETDAGAMDFLGFTPTGEDETGRQFATGDEAWLLRLAESGRAEDGDLGRLCVLQARNGGLQAVRAGVAQPLEQAGFVRDPEMPADRPIWTRAGVTVALRQNSGRATLMRVSWSAMDAD